MAELLAPGPEQPIYMVNLLKFKKKAVYEDERETNLTGAEAYGLYTDRVSQLLPKFGGALLYSANVTGLRLGEVEDLWDKVAIAMYPSRRAMLDMMRSDEMTEIRVHRAAGLEGQLNIETSNPNGAWLDPR